MTSCAYHRIGQHGTQHRLYRRVFIAFIYGERPFHPHWYELLPHKMNGMDSLLPAERHLMAQKVRARTISAPNLGLKRQKPGPLVTD